MRAGVGGGAERAGTCSQRSLSSPHCTFASSSRTSPTSPCPPPATAPAAAAAATAALPTPSHLSYLLSDPEASFSVSATPLLFKHLRINEVQVLASFRGKSSLGIDSFERLALKLFLAPEVQRLVRVEVLRE